MKRIFVITAGEEKIFATRFCVSISEDLINLSGVNLNDQWFSLSMLPNEKFQVDLVPLTSVTKLSQKSLV